MASDKKPGKIGFDPLSWMREEDLPSAEEKADEEIEKEVVSVSSANIETASDAIERQLADDLSDSAAKPKRPAAKKKAVKKKAVRKKAETKKAKSQPGNKRAESKAMNIDLLEETFAALAPHADTLVDRFYNELFKRHPEVKPLFAGVDMGAQKDKLVAALAFVVNNVRDPDALIPALQDMGKKHQFYGVEPEHYSLVASTLLDVMKEMAGDLWTQEVAESWTEALNTVAKAMIDAYEEGTEAMVANNKGIMGMVNVMGDILEHAPLNIMMADAEENIVFVNKKARDTLIELESELSQYIPGFKVSEVMGGSIHRYHKDPGAIKNILSGLLKGGVRNGYITPGPFVFEHETRPLYDDAGEKVGYVVQWHDITQQRLKELEAARLSSAVEGSTTAMMMCDMDANVTYANSAVLNLLASHQETLRSVFPGFDVKNVVGSNIDQFHKNPAMQRGLIADPSKLPYTANIKVASLEFKLTLSAIIDPKGEQIGCALEWVDITEEMDAQRQIESLISNAINGELEERITTDSYQGFMKDLGDGVNKLLDAVVTPLTETRRILQHIAENDLTQEMDGEYNGDFAVLQGAINDSILNLRRTVSDIRKASKSISTASSEIAQGNTDLSQRTEEQAASLEETASSMEELTSTVKQNADNAREANQLASSTREHAEKGGEVVNNAIDAMAEINNSSKKISDIIGVIDEIAFQTNLLALNAAVEAARAGEQGRGFAVVASEVRNLAQRSAGAAKEIKTLIKDSVSKVEDGTRLVDESGNTLQVIVNMVKKVSDIIAEIAAASQEQSSGIEQVNKAVMHMDEATQQNAALVEEAAAASESLDEQTHSLDRMVSVFRVNENDVEEEPAPAAPAPAPRVKRPPVKTAPVQSPTSGDSDDEWEEF